MKDFGFGSWNLQVSDFLEEGRIIQLGYPPNRIDLLTTLSGLTFDDCYKDKVQIELEGIRVDFIDLENLRENKLATGRLQDLADPKNLEP